MGLLKSVDGLVDKVRSSGSAQSFASVPQGPPAPKLGPDSVIRYRKQRGLNLGCWFVLEKWIAWEPFRNAAAPGESDLDVAKGRDAKATLEEHWDNWMKDEDWAWIKEHGYNSVRLPIGYYHLCSQIPDVLKDTDFEPYKDVFQDAWPRIERAIETAKSHGLGVLVDLHAAAGAQNNDRHAGISTGKADLFNKSANLKSTSLALRFLASYLAPKPYIVGLELLNEPARDGRLEGWYTTTLKELRSVAGWHFPLYIHDMWETAQFAPYTGRHDDFVVLDHHLYRCFSDGDKQFSGEQHAHKLRSEFGGTFSGQANEAKGSLVVGEWSGALDDWNKGIPEGERDRHKREFVRAQLELFDKATAGHWMWTYKKADGWDAGWSARDATVAEILPKWVGSKKFKGPPSQQVKDEEQKKGQDAHSGYWSKNGGSPNPAVYSPGFARGWDDALHFLSYKDGVSEMGFTDRWAARRKKNYERDNGALGDAAWEWEHGFKQGVEACTRIALGD